MVILWKIEKKLPIYIKFLIKGPLTNFNISTLTYELKQLNSVKKKSFDKCNNNHSIPRSRYHSNIPMYYVRACVCACMGASMFV